MLSLVASILIAASPCDDGPTNRYDDKGQPTGRWIAWHPTKVLASDYCYVGGRLEGLATNWHPSGRLSSQGHYRDGRPVGRWRNWDAWGNVSELEYLGGGQGYTPKKNGRLTYYGPHGVTAEGGWLDDARHGRWVNYFATGRTEETYDRGQRIGTFSQFDAKGALTHRSEWRAGVQHGTATMWSGRQKTQEATYVDGALHGTFTQWFDNGAVNATGTYARGKMDGLWTGNHANGAPRFRNHYVAGRLDGPWIEWDDAGRVTADQLWRAGERVR